MIRQISQSFSGHGLLLVSLLAASASAQSAHSNVLAEERGGPSLLLHIDSNNPNIELFRIVGGGAGVVSNGYDTAAISITSFKRVCRAPCDRLITDVDSDFFLAGDGITASSKFGLQDRGSGVTAQVKAGNATLRWVGWSSVVLGVSAAIAGALLYGLSSGISSGGSAGGGDFLGGMAGAGLGTLIGGAVATAVGIPLIAFNGTSVQFAPGPSAPARLEAKGDEI